MSFTDPDRSTYADEMNSTADLATAAAGRDPMIALRALTALRQDLDLLEARQVRAAREEGWSWQQIAEPLGVSKQAAHKKHAIKKPARKRPKAKTAGKPRSRTTRT